MKTAGRLGLYGGALAVVFATAATAGAAVVPDTTVAAWTQAAEGTEMDHGNGHTEAQQSQQATPAPAARGVSIAQDGFVLSPVTAPGRVGAQGELAFQVVAPDGTALTRYQESHQQRLHLIVVRSDGAQFRHVHPTLAADGTWSLPWSWEAAGSYRVYTDFTPDTGDAAAAPDLTLTRTVDVAGEFTPAPATVTSRATTVDGYDVTLQGDLRVGADTDLTVTVRRDGQPVTTLQPYLGAFGHLVVLRQGDLAYLHVHPTGEDPAQDAVSGPSIPFMTSAPTAGRYLLYLDFKVDGQVHTATFALDAAQAAPSSPTTSPTGDSGSTGQPGAGHSH